MSETPRPDVGDLKPFRELATELSKWDQTDRTRGEVDAQLGRIRSMLEKAIADAAGPFIVEGMRPADFARASGITVSAVYKRLKRGSKRGPRVTRTASGRIRIVDDAA